MSQLEETIKSIQASSSPEEAFACFNKAMNRYGYNNNCYTLMNDHISINRKAYHGLATTYPEDWINYYKEKEYQKVDAVWERLLQSPTPFFWKDTIKNLEHQKDIDEEKVGQSKKVMNEAEEAGVADGIGISFVSVLGEIAGIGLSREQAEKISSYEDMAEVYLIASVFHDKYIGLHETQELPKITGREREILLWSAEGKTDWETAEILGLSVPTVRFHWKNIFTKMGVNSKTFATTMAIRHKLITPQLIRPPYQN